MGFQYPSFEIGQCAERIGQLPGSRILQHDKTGFVVRIRKCESRSRQIIEEFLLGFQVILDCLMIIQVITRQIGKDTSVERQAADTLLVDRMRTDFHKSILATGFHHPSHQIMKGDRVRCRMISRDCFAIDIIANGRE